MNATSPLRKWPRRFFSALGPGLVTGAADDDPSGIATYSIAGAQLGTSLLWTALLTWPLMARSEEHTSELQSRQYLHSFPTRRSSDLCSGRRSFRYRDIFHCRRAARNEPSLDGPPDLAAHGGGADDVRANRHGPGRRTGRGASKAHSETLRHRRDVLSSPREHDQHRS